jgi:BMFP domain-containing protein YqiC
MDTRLSELLDQKDYLEQQIALAIRTARRDREAQLRRLLAGVIAKIDALTVEEARQAAHQREFLR